MCGSKLIHSHITPTLRSGCIRTTADGWGRLWDDTLGFPGLLGTFPNVAGKVGGGQGWIRTSVRSRGQIYSLLPLTTRPPVHGCAWARQALGEGARRSQPLRTISTCLRTASANIAPPSGAWSKNSEGSMSSSSINWNDPSGARTISTRA